MSKEKVLRGFSALPPEAKIEVLDFIEFLLAKYRKLVAKDVPLQPLLKDPFLGMWAGREDMTDGSAWLRNHRKEEWPSSE